MKRVLFVFFLILGFQSLGQRYAKIGERDGIKYYIHKVTDGETLYGIQTLYGVDIEKIQEANNLLENIEKALGRLLRNCSVSTMLKEYSYCHLGSFNTIVGKSLPNFDQLPQWDMDGKRLKVKFTFYLKLV